MNKNPTNNYKKFDNEAFTRHMPVAVETDQASSCWTNDVKIIVKLNNARKIAICYEEDVNKLSKTGKKPPSKLCCRCRLEHRLVRALSSDRLCKYQTNIIMFLFLCQPNQVKNKSFFFIKIVQNSIVFCLDDPTMSNTCVIVFVLHHMCSYLFTFSGTCMCLCTIRLSCTYLFTCKCLRYYMCSLLSLVHLILFSLLLVSYLHLF